MKRLSLIFAIAVLLVGIPVQAQKNNRPIIQPAPIIQPGPGLHPAGVLVQGDNGEGFMIFDMKSGAFTCNLCEYGYELKGVGNVKIDGCNVYFSVGTDNYNVFASVNMCDHSAKCVVEVYGIPDKDYTIQPVTEYLIDTDMLNSKPDCSVTPTK